VIKGIQVPVSIQGAFERVATVGSSVVKLVKGLVGEAIQGAMDSGVDEKYAVKGSVSQALYTGREFSYRSRHGSCRSCTRFNNAVKQVGGDTLGTTKNAIIPALEAAKEIGNETTNSVKAALKEGGKEAIAILNEIKKITSSDSPPINIHSYKLPVKIQAAFSTLQSKSKESSLPKISGSFIASLLAKLQL